MFGGRTITIEEVLKKVSEEELFRLALGYYPKIGRYYKSPFRPDKTPRCRFQAYQNKLYFVDNARYKGKLSFSPISMLKELTGKAGNSLYSYILDNTSHSSNFTKVLRTQQPKFKAQIRFKYLDWTVENNIFNNLDIPHTRLFADNTYLVSDYWVTTRKNRYFIKNLFHNPRKTSVIAYYFPETDHTKLYFIDQEDFKWYSNCVIEDIFGWQYMEQFLKTPEYLIITKSEKDRKLIHESGYNCIALQNEGCEIPNNKLQIINKFKNIFLLFDNDTAGVDAANKLKELYNFKIIFIPKYKDMSTHKEHNKREDVNLFITNLILQYEKLHR